MSKLLVAVSGGVDSMVLLDIATKNKKYEVIVGHVDHGIRPESADEARFVEASAKQYNVEFVSKRFELSEDASEEAARTARYEFLFEQSKKLQAVIATAHHRDDMVGSVAINLIRGTGWRGLAVMNRHGIIRPLLSMTKSQIYDYAIRHKLEWVEDETNRSRRYLRNRLRADLLHLPEETLDSLARLRNRQVEISQDIADELRALNSVSAGSRYFLSMIETQVAEELLRHQISDQTGRLLQPEQIKRAILAVKTAKQNTTYEVGEGVSITFSNDRFIVDTHL